MGMFSAAADVAVDLGSVNTCIYTRGAVALNEPSVVGVQYRSRRIEAIGTDAHDMLGRTPANITAVWPMRNGVVADCNAVEQMLAHFVRKARGRTYGRSRLVIGVTGASTQLERRAVRESAKRMKVGGGTTDIAVVSLAGLVYGRSLRLAGGDMDEAIIQHLKRQHSLLIGEPTAERIKREIGSAAPLEKPLRMDVKGRHITEGVPRTVTVTDAEIREALSEPIRGIVKAVREALGCVPPELSGDIYERGVMLTGGVALLRKLDVCLRKETGLPVMVADDPLASVVIGAGRLLGDPALLLKVAVH